MTKMQKRESSTGSQASAVCESPETAWLWSLGRDCDMLLLAVKHKLFELDGSDIVDFIVALQLYTPSFDPPGVIFEDLNKQKRVMRADKLYKFSDGTLKTVRDELHHRLLNFRIEYNDDMSRRK
ncbi:hypothetical protein Tco_1347071 [Tanacetum coccineum]